MIKIPLIRTLTPGRGLAHWRRELRTMRTTKSQLSLPRAELRKPFSAFVTACAATLLLLALPAAVQAEDFTYTTNNGTITVTSYIGLRGVATIPDLINGMPVARIGDFAFYRNANLTSITIPGSVNLIGVESFGACYNLSSVSIGDNVTTIDDGAFGACARLTTLTIPNSVTTIGSSAFPFCTSLTNISIGNSVTSIGGLAFEGCAQLTNIVIPKSVTSIGAGAFALCSNLRAISVEALNSVYSSVDGVLFKNGQTTLVQYPAGKAGGYAVPTSVTNIDQGAFAMCSNLTSVTIDDRVVTLYQYVFLHCGSLTAVRFQGDAPSLGSSVFDGDDNAIVYYLPGTTGWGATFGGRPTALWLPQVQTTDASFGVRTNRFGFNIAWASGQTVVVEACTDLDNPVWSPLQTNTLAADLLYYSDPDWANHPDRFYRVRSP